VIWIFHFLNFAQYRFIDVSELNLPTPFCWSRILRTFWRRFFSQSCWLVLVIFLSLI